MSGNNPNLISAGCFNFGVIRATGQTPTYTTLNLVVTITGIPTIFQLNLKLIISLEVNDKVPYIVSAIGEFLSRGIITPTIH